MSAGSNSFCCQVQCWDFAFSHSWIKEQHALGSSPSLLLEAGPSNHRAGASRACWSRSVEPPVRTRLRSPRAALTPRVLAARSSPAAWQQFLKGSKVLDSEALLMLGTATLTRQPFLSAASQAQPRCPYDIWAPMDSTHPSFSLPSPSPAITPSCQQHSFPCLQHPGSFQPSLCSKQPHLRRSKASPPQARGTAKSGTQ